MRSGSYVTGAVYRRVLEEHLVPHGRSWYRNNWLLADDSARPHRACVVDAYINEQAMICNLRPRAHVHITFYVHVQVDIYHTYI